MKTYTDLEQSKKLAEVLPTESADMFCADVFDKEKETHSYNFHILSTWGCNTFEDLKDRENKFVRFIPAWSLAALLDVLPLETELHKQSDGNIIYYYIEYTTKETYFASKRYTNPIDAAFEMVCWLLKT